MPNAEEVIIRVAIDFGTTRNKKRLSAPSRKILEAVVADLNQTKPADAIVLFCLPDLKSCMPVSECKTQKLEVFRGVYKPPRFSLVWYEATNSITEASHAPNEIEKQLHMSADLVTKLILWVADEWHALRVVPIWRYYFPNAQVEVRIIPSVVGSDFGQMLLRSPFTWRPLNVVLRFAMDLFGIERFARLKQP